MPTTTIRHVASAAQKPLLPALRERGLIHQGAEGRGGAAPQRESDTGARREAIRSLIRTRPVATQEDLRQLLVAEGYEVTQATLSRDLARLGARRASSPEGGTAYEIDEAVSAVPDPLAEVADMVTSIVDNGSLVILYTQPGAASAVARAIDMAKLPESLGTLAGDDTIFLAPYRGKAASSVTKRLRALFRKGSQK